MSNKWYPQLPQDALETGTTERVPFLPLPYVEPYQDTTLLEATTSVISLREINENKLIEKDEQEIFLGQPPVSEGQQFILNQDSDWGQRTYTDVQIQDINSVETVLSPDSLTSVEFVDNITNENMTEQGMTEEKVYYEGMDAYEILGVSPDASLQEIKTNYRKMVYVWHPDRCRLGLFVQYTSCIMFDFITFTFADFLMIQV